MTWHTLGKTLIFSTLSLTSQIATSASSKQTPTTPLSFDILSQLILALIIVICVIILAAWVMRRFNIVGVLTNPYIRVIASQALGAREKLVIIKVADEYLLLGVSAQQINLLHRFNDFSEITPQQFSGEDIRSKFAQILKGEKR